jgi:hypothetical protein
MTVGVAHARDDFQAGNLREIREDENERYLSWH